MNTKTQKQRSKYLSWLLRHGAVEAGVTMDAAGWVDVSTLLAKTGWSRSTLDDLVATNTKRRLQYSEDGSQIRCCQGHSTENMPVTLDALEDSWTPYSGDTIWHCTNLDALEFIVEEGCKPIARTHVHCTSSLDSAVGKRSRTPIGLEISVSGLRDAGVETFVAPNGVVLVRRVPRECIVGLVGMTRRGLAEEERLRDRFGFA